MQEETSDPVERWMAKRHAALILAILKGETSVTQATRQHQLMIAEVEAWRDWFLLAAENVRQGWSKDHNALNPDNS